MEKLATRDAYGKKLIELGYKIPELLVLDADLAGSTRTGWFKKEFPDRHFNMGIAECNMLLFAAGLAVAGKTVFASSFAIFETGRAWEIIRNTISHDNLNVKIVSSHSGISVGEDGYSHQSNEDIAIMRAIPNLQVIVPADANETKQVIEYAAYNKGPMYIRLGRPSVPTFLDAKGMYVPNKGDVLTDCKDFSGTIIATGGMVYRALEAAKNLKKENIDVRVVNMSNIKPIDEKLIIESAKKSKFILTCEEHSVIGGLGSAVSEITSTTYPIKVERMGMKDVYGQSGSPQELFKFYQLTSDDIFNKVKELLK